jgi:hypothetical protein
MFLTTEMGFAKRSIHPCDLPPDPTVKSLSRLSSPPLQKYSDFPKTQITFITLPVLSHRGAARDRHGRGTGCGGRVGAFDEQRRMRTAKSCGPDASTLASSSWEASFSGVTVTKKPDRRGELDISRKTIARGMPGDAGVT